MVGQLEGKGLGRSPDEGRGESPEWFEAGQHGSVVFEAVAGEEAEAGRWALVGLEEQWFALGAEALMDR